MLGKYYKINITSKTSWMLAFTIRLYNAYKFYDIDISGYNYGTNHWYNPTAKLANSTENSIEVTFGYDADWELWICIPAASYTGLDIFNVTNGFTQIDLFNAFSISLVDAIPATIQSTQLIYRPWRQSDNVTAYNALMLTNARTFQIADNDATNKGPTVSFNGTANVIINLPSTIKASLTGNASTATALTTSAGSASRPVYFSSGKPTQITLTLPAVAITTGFDTAFRTSINGSTSISPFLGVVRTDTASVTYAPQYGSGIVWGRGDTHGYLSASYNNGIAYLGGGNADKLNWVKQIAFIDSNITGNAATATLATKATQDGSGNIITSTYLKLSGGTMTGALNFKNSTLNSMGDDAYIGDQDKAGCICIKGANSTTGLAMIQYGASATGYIRWDGTYFQPANSINFSSMTGEWSSAPNWSNAFIVFGSRTHDQVSGTYYMPWLSGVDYVTSHGYGATVTLGIYHNNAPSNGGLYIGMSWDGKANDTFYTFRRDGVFTAPSVYGAVWNDYAEYRSGEITEPGRVVHECPDGIMRMSTKRLEPACEIISDTFGFAIGETDECKTPIAAAGRVLAYVDSNRYDFNLGDAVCSGVNGTVSKMTREEIMMYPERIIGTVSEIPEYETWGTGNVKVNGRIWIRIK